MTCENKSIIKNEIKRIYDQNSINSSIPIKLESTHHQNQILIAKTANKL